MAINVDLHCCLRMVQRDPEEYMCKNMCHPPPPPPHTPPPTTHPSKPTPPTHTLPLPNNFPPHFTPPTPLPNPRLHKMYNNVPRGRGGGWVAINVDQHCCLRMVQRDPCPPPPPLRGIYLQKMVSPTIVITKTTIATTCYLAMLSY